MRTMLTGTTGLSAMISALAATGPLEERRKHLELFGRFVGEWDVEVTKYTPDGSTQKAKGEWLFDWTLEGYAIQDVWAVPGREDRLNGDSKLIGYGTTVRFYDPEIDAWRVTWMGVLTHKVYTFIARQHGDEIVMEGRNEDDLPMRWVFSEITPSSFRWRNVLSEDGGTSWKLQQEMRVTRRLA
jgi:hypothetical protein